MITANSIRTIKDHVLVLDTLKITRIENDGIGAVFHVSEYEEDEESSVVLYSGYADDVAMYVNRYFDISGESFDKWEIVKEKVEEMIQAEQRLHNKEAEKAYHHIFKFMEMCERFEMKSLS